MNTIKKILKKVFFNKNNKVVTSNKSAVKPTTNTVVADTPGAVETIAKLATPSSAKNTLNTSAQKKPGRPKSQDSKSVNKKPSTNKTTVKKKAADK